MAIPTIQELWKLVEDKTIPFCTVLTGELTMNDIGWLKIMERLSQILCKPPK